MIIFSNQKYIHKAIQIIYIYNFLKMRTQNQENNSLNVMTQQKKTILPFLIRKAPFENCIAYEKKGHWTQKEKLKYVIFLQYFKEKFTSRDNKKRFCRIFKVMSDFIKTRTHNQCRSHHQKMEKQRFQVDSIIKNVASKYHPRIYKELCQRYLVQIENLIFQQYEDQNLERNGQRQMKYGTESNINYDKKDPKINLRQIEIKNNTKNVNESKQARSAKIKQEQNQKRVDKITFKKKQLKFTQQCQESQNQEQKYPKKGCFEFPPQKDQYLQSKFNSECQQNNYPYNLPFQPFSQFNGGFSNFLENLEVKRLECLNNAAFHYNQMQMELRSVAECQRAKSMVLGEEERRVNEQKYVDFQYSNAGWGFSNLNKPF